MHPGYLRAVPDSMKRSPFDIGDVGREHSKTPHLLLAQTKVMLPVTGCLSIETARCHHGFAQLFFSIRLQQPAESMAIPFVQQPFNNEDAMTVSVQFMKMDIPEKSEKADGISVCVDMSSPHRESVISIPLYPIPPIPSTEQRGGMIRPTPAETLIHIFKRWIYSDPIRMINGRWI